MPAVCWRGLSLHKRNVDSPGRSVLFPGFIATQSHSFLVGYGSELSLKKVFRSGAGQQED